MQYQKRGMPDTEIYTHTQIEQVEDGLFTFVIESTISHNTPCTCFHRGDADSAAEMARSMIDHLHKRYFQAIRYSGSILQNMF